MAEILRSLDDDQVAGKSTNPEQEKETLDLSKTALGPAECRVDTDIPFSKVIYEELKRLFEEEGKTIPKQLDTESVPTEYLTLFEARYKFTNKLIRENESKQILEMASGYSPRGIEMAQDGSVNYVELDKPDVANTKRTIVENLSANKKIPKEPNLHIVSGDAFDAHDMEMASIFFSDKPLIILNEGLFKYFEKEKIATLAENVRRLLIKFGGVWITPDCSLDIPSIKESDKKIEERTGFDFKNNGFKSAEEFRAFFEQLGFIVEQRNFGEMAHELVSPKKIGLSKKETNAMTKKANAFVMRVAE